MRSLRPLLVLGAGGFARNVIDVVEAMNRVDPCYRLLGVLDDDRSREDRLRRRGYRIVGNDAALAELAADYLIGIADPGTRARLDEYASSVGRTPAVAVHPAASVSDAAQLGPGTVLAAGSRVASDVVLGRHFHGNFNSTIGHDVVTGDHVTVHPLAAISGNVVLEERVTIGTGSAVLPGLRIGARSTVGAGAVVVRDVPCDTVMVGVPARPLGVVGG